MAYPRFRRARAHKSATSLAAGSDYTITGTWAKIDATRLEVTLAECQVGDELELDLRATMAPGGGEALYFDISVAGARLGHATAGSYIGDIPGTFELTHRLTCWHVLTAPDLVAGVVTVAAWAKTSGTSRSMRYAAPPVRLAAKNLGPAQA